MEEFEVYYNKALKFLSYRPRSEEEVRRNLFKKNAYTETVEKIIAKLKEYNFIDDHEFVRWWIEQRTKFRPRALRLIKIELRQKGVSPDLIDEETEKLNISKDRDLDSAKKLIEKRIRRYKDLPREEKFTKVSRYLASKGFNYDIIKEIIKEI